MGISTFIQELLTPQMLLICDQMLSQNDTFYVWGSMRHISHISSSRSVCICFVQTSPYTQKNWRFIRCHEKLFEISDAPLTSKLAINCCCNLEWAERRGHTLTLSKKNPKCSYLLKCFISRLWFVENHLYFVQLVYRLIFDIDFVLFTQAGVPPTSVHFSRSPPPACSCPRLPNFRVLGV